MNEIADNPLAFPSVGQGFGSPQYSAPGMTLRDWFAGQALGALVTVAMETGNSPELTANCAYHIADAMLLSRQSNGESGK